MSEEESVKEECNDCVPEESPIVTNTLIEDVKVGRDDRARCE